VLLTGIEDTGDEREMQVYRAGAPQAEEGHKHIDNGLSYFHLFSEQKWFPLGGTTNHKVSLKVAKESAKAVKAAMLGPVFAKVGSDTGGKYQFIGGDEDIGICDSRFAELATVLQPPGAFDQEHQDRPLICYCRGQISPQLR
jgi:hypothetical protein